MELFCRISGSGRPIIILHGLLGMSDNWQSIANRLSQQFTVFVPDLRNHGRSPHSNAFGYDVMLDDLIDLIDKYSIIDPAIIGHSMGGKLAMLFALKYPTLINRLIVADIHPDRYKPDRGMLLLLETMRKLDISEMNSLSEAERFLKSLIRNPALVQLLMKNIRYNENKVLAWKPDVNSIYENLGGILDPVGEGLSCEVKSCFICGGDSDYITESDHPAIHHKFHNAEIQTIIGAGHWVHADKPEAFLASVVAFLGK